MLFRGISFHGTQHAKNYQEKEKGKETFTLSSEWIFQCLIYVVAHDTALSRVRKRERVALWYNKTKERKTFTWTVRASVYRWKSEWMERFTSNSKFHTNIYMYASGYNLEIGLIFTQNSPKFQHFNVTTGRFLSQTHPLPKIVKYYLCYVSNTSF